MSNQTKREKIKAQIELDMALKPSSLNAYARAIEKFCSETKLDPLKFKSMKLEDIEEITTRYIMKNKDKLAPKYLNVIFNAVKTWCYINKLIKNRKMFKEIKFDKSSRKVDSITEEALEPSHIKKLFQIGDIDEKILLYFYATNALRPAIIPQLKIKDIYPKHYTVESGVFKFTVKNPFLYVRKEYEGNKAHITYFIILHSQQAKLIEQSLNMNNVIKKTDTIMQKYKASNNIYDKIKDMYRKVNFDGRPYLLRSFGDRLLDKTIAQTTTTDNRKDDLKEYMMGHKGMISAIYQFKQLTNDDIKEYTNRYQSVENYINEHILGKVSKEQLTKAEAMKQMAQNMGVTPQEALEIFSNFTKGKMSLATYEKELVQLTKKAQEKEMHRQFKKLFDAEMANLK